jgi:hypothetical protein
MKNISYLIIFILIISCGSSRFYTVYENTTENERYNLVIYKDSTFLLEWHSTKIDMLGGYGYGTWSQKNEVLTLNSNQTNRIDSIKYSNLNICNQLNSYEEFNLLNYEQNRAILFDTNCNNIMQVRLYDSQGYSVFPLGQIAINEANDTYRTELFQLKNTDSIDVVTYLKKQIIDSLEVYYDGWSDPIKIKLNNSEEWNTVTIFGNFVSSGLRPKILVDEKWNVEDKNTIENNIFGKFKKITTANTVYN